MADRARPTYRWLLFGLVAALVVSCGCLGSLGPEGLQFTADPVSIDYRAVAAAGFELRGSDSFEVDQTVEVGGETRRVVVTSHTVTLRKEYRGAPLGHVVALSTPQASVLGQGLNPLGTIDAEDLVGRVLGRSPAVAVDDLERRGTVSMRALGEERTVDRFDASGDRGAVDVYLTRFEHGDDYVVVLGVVPEGADDGPEAFRTLLGGLGHGTA